jgi:predicted PurR-regulated permease PerM
MTQTSPPAFDRLDYIYKLLVVAALLITATILASDLVIPMAFAGLFSIVMLPAVKKLEERRIPTSLSITLVLLATIIVMGLFIWLIVGQVVSLVNDLPNLETKFQTFVENTSQILLRDFGISTAEQNKMLGDLMRTFSAYAGALLLGTTNTLSTMIQIPIYIFLFLIYRDKFRDFFISILRTKEDLAWKKDVERVVQGYLSGLMLVTLIVAALNSIGLMIVGIDHAIFFGVLSGVLTIIPYIGIIIGALFPIIMALITKDSIWYTIGVVIVFTIVQFLEGNFITPKITGSKVSINALAAIIALVIGGKILGISGMILAVPGIGLLKILLSYSWRLKPFVILLEDTPPQKPEVVIAQASEPPPSAE